MAEDSAKLAVADLLDSVRWDYDPESDQLSPLVSTERYFRDFPWEPAEVFPARPAPGREPAAEREPGGED
jgi:hypothetical protein